MARTVGDKKVVHTKGDVKLKYGNTCNEILQSEGRNWRVTLNRQIQSMQELCLNPIMAF
jgi:hypothetical protein